MLVRASSTARVIDLHCALGNPKASVSRSTAPRTTESSLGLLYMANISKRPPRGPDLWRRSLLAVGRGKVFTCDMGGLFGEIVGSFEIPAKKANLSVHIPLQECVSVRSRELTMNADGRCAGNRCYLPGPFATRLKASNGAVENN